MKEVLAVFPKGLRVQAAERMEKIPVEEFRLRRGRSLSYVYQNQEIVLNTPVITEENLTFILERACDFSIHAVQNQISRGFVTISGGHRVGICGRPVLENGTVEGFREVSSLSVRICRENRGIAGELLNHLHSDSGFENTLICSPPGCGKTTLLREIIRRISNGEGCPPSRIAVVDERSEIGGGAVNTFDLGRQTDIMDGCPKNIALIFLLRSMNPQILAVDEITAQEDVETLQQVIGCGVKILATAHGVDKKDLFRRKIYRSLLEQDIFQRIITISFVHQERVYQTEVFDSADIR